MWDYLRSSGCPAALCRFDAWEPRQLVEIVRLYVATAKQVDLGHQRMIRNARVGGALHQAHIRLADAETRRQLLLGKPLSPPPGRELQNLYPFTNSPVLDDLSAAQTADATSKYFAPLYLVNGHNENAGAVYNAVSYPLLMHPTNRIRELRKRAGLSQAELGDRCGLSQEQISQLENDKRPLTLDYMRVIARELGVSTSELLPDPDIPERLSDEEAQLLRAFRSSPGGAREFLLTSAKAVAQQIGDEPGGRAAA